MLTAAIALCAGAPVSAQFLYLDTNGDGLSSFAHPALPADVLTSTTTSVDVYFDTSHDEDGATVSCNVSTSPLSINSYEVVLTWTGEGTVVFGGWTNNMPGFTVNLTGGPGGVVAGKHDIWIGLGNVTQLPPGLYKVGTLALAVTGSPVITWLSSSSLNTAAETAFGSICEGVDFNNTYKLGSDFTSARGTEQPASQMALNTTWEKIETLYR
jgi:hypothetical protein